MAESQAVPAQTSPSLLDRGGDLMSRAAAVGLWMGLMSAVCCAQSLAPSAVPAATSPTAAPAPASNPLGEAHALYRKGDFDGAISIYKDILKDHPKNPDAWAGLVRIYLKQRNVDLAAQTADQGIAQGNAPRVRVARAEVWFRQGRISDAEGEWVAVVNSGLPEPRAFLGLARVRHAVAMYKSEKVMLDKAHALDPTDPDIEEAWYDTLSRAERIRYLEASLAGENNWDADKRADLSNYLQFLRERARRKTSPCSLVSKVTSTEMQLVRLLRDPEHLRGYGLAVQLNGHKSSLMLDTGASGILVKRSIAEHAGISKISEAKVRGIGNKGRRNGFVGMVDSIKIGDLEFHNCPIQVMDSRSVVEEDGLIGSDVMEDFLVDIDFPAEKLRLSPLPGRPGEAEKKPVLASESDDSDDDDSGEPKPASDDKPAQSAPAKTASGRQDRYIAPEMQNYARVYRFGHHLLVPTSIGNVPRKLFLVDTGSTLNLIAPSAAREVTKVSSDTDMKIKGISGNVDHVFMANKAVLQFGRIRQENQEISGFDMSSLSDGIGTEVSGFLGFVTLRMLEIKIDYRDALVDFHFDPTRFH